MMQTTVLASCAGFGPRFWLLLLIPSPCLQVPGDAGMPSGPASYRVTRTCLRPGLKLYWDGGLWSNTPLPEVLNALQTAGPREERYQVYIIDVFPKQGQVPQTNWEVWQRISELSYADKTSYDKKASEWVNKYIDLVNRLREVRSQLPPALAELVQEHIPQVEKRIILDITTIARSA